MLQISLFTERKQCLAECMLESRCCKFRYLRERKQCLGECMLESSDCGLSNQAKYVHRGCCGHGSFEIKGSSQRDPDYKVGKETAQ